MSVEQTKSAAAPALSPKAALIKEVSGRLQALLEKNISAMPKNFNQTRFLQNCLAVLLETKNIEQCTPMSVARAMIKGAYLGLDFFRRECYAIPYKNKDTGAYDCNFQTDYKGEIKLCHIYSHRPILDIYAKLVREGDELEIAIRDNKPIIQFLPKQFNDGPVIGAFAACTFTDGGVIYDTMSKADVEKIRQQYSKAPDSPAWSKSPGEMYKKVVLRRLLKLVSLDFDNSEQDEAFEEGAQVDLNKQLPAPVEIPDPFSGQSEARSQAEDAQVVDENAALRKSLKEKNPTYQDWQIDALVKEHKETKQ